MPGREAGDESGKGGDDMVPPVTGDSRLCTSDGL